MASKGWRHWETAQSGQSPKRPQGIIWYPKVSTEKNINGSCHTEKMPTLICSITGLITPKTGSLATWLSCLYIQKSKDIKKMQTKRKKKLPNAPPGTDNLYLLFTFIWCAHSSVPYFQSSSSWLPISLECCGHIKLNVQHWFDQKIVNCNGKHRMTRIVQSILILICLLKDGHMECFKKFISQIDLKLFYQITSLNII